MGQSVGHSGIAPWQERTALLVGEDGARALSDAHVVVVGLGGVGAWAAEMLARAGVSHMTIIDSDSVSESNLNRQLPALVSTLGRPKTAAVAERLRDINPDIDLTVLDAFICEENIPDILEPLRGGWTLHIVDAIDTLSPKIALIQYCLAHKGNVRLVSSMGCGAKMDITRIRICDISKTRECPLAFMIRKRLHKLGIYSGFRAVFSEELPMQGAMVIEESRNKKSQVGSISYMPAAFGCACAQATVEAILKEMNKS